MRFGKKIKFLNLAVLLIFLTACTTVSYRYTPPNSESGRMCLNQCLQMRSQCRNHCQHLKMQHDTLTSINRAVNNQNSYVYNDPYYESSCLENCENDYRACYTNCGGYIERIEEPMF